MDRITEPVEAAAGAVTLDFKPETPLDALLARWSSHEPLAYVDDATLYQYRYRAYDPEPGRWMDLDPAPYVEGLDHFQDPPSGNDGGR